MPMSVDDRGDTQAPRPRECKDAVAMPRMAPCVDHDQPLGRDHDDGIAVGPTFGKHRTWKKVGIRRDLARRRWSGSTRHGLGERQSQHERRGHHYDGLQASADRRFRHAATAPDAAGDPAEFLMAPPHFSLDDSPRNSM